MKKNAIRGYELPNIKLAETILRNHPHRKMNADALARKVGLNVTKLQVGFKKVFGKSIYQFHLDLRLQVATDLLLTTDKTIQHIATRSGFKSADAFARCFRTKFDCTPSDWRVNRQIETDPTISGTIACATVSSPN